MSDNSAGAPQPAAKPSPTAPLLARVPPPIWALIYLLVAIGIDESRLLPFAWLYEPTLGTLFILGGLGSAVTAVIQFRKAGTAARPDARINAALVTDGIFARTRNPMYLGLVLVTLGIAFTQGTLPYFAVPLLVFFTNNAIVIPYEEAKMRRQFGATFDAYCKRVRRWL
jgi:protein-S-isoprenylcysteine O-methyltransferase Ste14